MEKKTRKEKKKVVESEFGVEYASIQVKTKPEGKV